MKNKLLKHFYKKIINGNERSIKAKKNILASIFIKGASMIIGFLMVRITLNYLDKTKYGIWLTLSSFLTWFTFFELGLGSGLRNKLAEALAIKNYQLGKIYVSTTYAILSIIISIVAILFFIANKFINWTIVLNTDKTLAHRLSLLALVVFGFFFLRFVVKLIGVVLYADQRPALANTFGPLGNLIALIIIYILTKTTKGSLIYLGWTLSAVPVLILIIASLYFYSKDYKIIAPSFKYIRLNYSKDLLNLGVKFFFIQIAGLIIYQSSNIIIAQFFGPEEVTIYNIAYKYFSILNMGFAIILMPFWSAFTEAWINKDIPWIKNSVRKLIHLWIGFSIFGIFMLLFSNKLYELWLGVKIKIPINLSFFMLLYFITFTFGGIFNMFINGVGKIKIQMYSSLIGSVFFIIFSIILIKYFKLNIISLVIASIISNFYGIFLCPIQYYKIINNKATGLWNK